MKEVCLYGYGGEFGDRGIDYVSFLKNSKSNSMGSLFELSFSLSLYYFITSPF